MLSTLRIFNPENDIALASGQLNFTAPKHAMQFARDCAFLPVWFSGESDAVVYESNNAAWEARVRKDFNLTANQFSKGMQFDKVAPWGWSDAIAYKLQRLGLPMDELTAQSGIVNLGKHRELSHRRTSILFNQRLSDSIDITDLAVEVNSMEEFERVAAHFGRYIVKAPWSSSGRGIIDSERLSTNEICRQVEGIIRRQGSVLIERKLDCRYNFAYLFEITDSGTQFLGPSIFSNSGLASYSQNIVASPTRLFQMLDDAIDTVCRDELISHRPQLPDTELMSTILNDLFADNYRGYLGVDMMLYVDNGRLRVAPCIEINLRCTMGVVAHLLAERYIDANSVAAMQMNITQIRPTNQDVLIGGTQHSSVVVGAEESCAGVEESYVAMNGKLKSGKVALTPPDNQFCITLEII